MTIFSYFECTKGFSREYLTHALAQGLEYEDIPAESFLIMLGFKNSRDFMNNTKSAVREYLQAIGVNFEGDNHQPFVFLMARINAYFGSINPAAAGEAPEYLEARRTEFRIVGQEHPVIVNFTHDNMIDIVITRPNILGVTFQSVHEFFIPKSENGPALIAANPELIGNNPRDNVEENNQRNNQENDDENPVNEDPDIIGGAIQGPHYGDGH